VKTFTKQVGKIPANARLVGYSLGEGTMVLFDDATHGTYGIELGVAATPAQIAASVSCKAGDTGFPKAGTAGALGFPGAPVGGLIVTAKLTSSVDLNTATAGTCTINVFYSVQG
jgi:hypothetical protein